MSQSLGEAVLDLSGDTSKLDGDISGLKSRLLTTLEGVGKMGEVILGAGLAVAGAGIAVLSRELYSSVNAAVEAEEVQAQLNAVLKSTGGVAGMTAEEVNSLADSLSQVTKFDDEAIIAGESLLLTFTNIGQDVFPQATETMLDMSQALGQDLQSSAIQLGKALQDPILGVSALRKVGVNFSEDQQKVIEKLVETGDLAGAQALILKALQTEFGGSAKAAGETFAGQLAILQTKMGNIKETIGAALLPALGQLATMFGEYLAKPEVQQFLKDLGQNIADLAAQVVANLPIFIENIQAAFGWFQDNQGVVVAALAAIGVAILAFGVTVATAAWTALSPLLPVIAIMALVGAAAYLLYEAWTNNWGGIRDSVMELWAVIEPYLILLRDWLQVQLTVAIQWLANFWTTVLLPAIQQFFAWVAAVVIPALIQLIQWLAVNVPKALATLADWWKTLKNTMSTAMAEGMLAVKRAISYLVNGFQNLVGAGGAVVEFLQKTFASAFANAAAAVRKVVGLVQNLLNSLKKLAESMPKMLTPGSPTPFEQGLWGIHDAMSSLSKMAVPALGGSMAMNLGGASVGSGARLNGDEEYAGAGGKNVIHFHMQKSDLNEDQLQRALLRTEMLYG